MTTFSYQERIPPRAPYERIYFAQETDVSITLAPVSGRTWNKVYIPTTTENDVYAPSDIWTYPDSSLYPATDLYPRDDGKIFTQDEIATINDSFLVFYNVDTETIDFYISSVRPTTLTITASNNKFTSISYTLKKGAQIFWGQYTYNDVENTPVLFPSLTLFPNTTLYPSNIWTYPDSSLYPATDLYPQEDEKPNFILNNIMPLISKHYFSNW